MKELKELEDGLAKLLTEIKFNHKYSSFQNKLSSDLKEIRAAKQIFVAGDKSSNFHKMVPEKYNELLNKEIHKEYKKAPLNVVKSIQESHSEIVKDLNIEDRVFKTTEKQPFITIKDHKPNYQNNPSCRLINPSKPEIGKVSQNITKEINNIVRKKRN